jgi:outer membrane receptor for ferrienterochelin and colicin
MISNKSFTLEWKALDLILVGLMLFSTQFSIAQIKPNNGALSFQNERVMDEKLGKLRSRYDERRYEDAYDLYKDLHLAHYNSVNDGDKMVILDWGIRLAFITEQWDDLDRYITEYYSLDPYFSAESLKESSPQLQTYIGNFVRAKSEQFVYVNKHKQNIDLIPASITVYTKEDIDRLGARNLLDLIRITPGFAELGDNNERIIGTRGTSSTSLQDILILINGHRISDVFTNTNGPDWLSLDYVEQVEIMRGPGSALYGENAFSGVINIITKDGRYKNTNRLSVKTGTGNTFKDISPKYNTYNIHYEYGRKLSNSEGVYLSATYTQSGGSEIDHSVLNESTILPDVVGTDTIRTASTGGREHINRYGPGYNILLNYNRKSLKVTSNAQSNAFVYSRPSSLNLWKSDTPDERRNRIRKDSREFVHIDYGLFDNSDRFEHDLRFKLSGDHFHKDIYFPSYSHEILGNQRVLGDEFRGTTSLEFSSDSLMKNFDRIGDQHFLIGVEAYFNNWHYNYFVGNDSSFTLPQTEDYFTKPGESKFEYIAAAYTQTEQHLIQDVLIATAGVRLNYHSKYSRFDKFEWGKQYSPRFALIFLAPKTKRDINLFKAKVLYNSAFFPPPFLYRRGGIFGFQGSDSLTVQKIESGELVLSGDLPNKLFYSVMFYANKIDNIIENVFVPSIGGRMYINAPRARRNSGVELEIRHTLKLNKFDLKSFYNYSLAMENNFNDSKDHNYFEIFNGKYFTSTSALTNYPASMANIGLDLITKGKEESGESGSRAKVSVGSNIQWIGETTVYSSYSLIQGNLVLNSDGQQTKSMLPQAFIMDARFKVYYPRMNFGISAYNVANTSYYLPSVNFSSRRQNAEGRMILLNFTYLINVK